MDDLRLSVKSDNLSLTGDNWGIIELFKDNNSAMFLAFRQ